ncbi:MAG: LVIVD repeat-containing protein [Candidatus Hodarchaeales archaeon]
MKFRNYSISRRKLYILLIIQVIPLLIIFQPVEANNSQYALKELSSIPAKFNSQIVDVKVINDIIFVLDAFHGLTAYNVSDPAHPSQLGHFSDSDTFVHSILIVDDYAYLSDYEDGLEIIDISDPTDLKIIGRYQPDISSPATSIDAYFSNNLVFLASQSRGLEIINCSNPSNPFIIDTYYSNHRVIRLFSLENLVFISEAHNGFKILNITNGACSEIYHFHDSVSFQDFQIQNDLLFTTDMNFGLQVFNISILSNITKVGEYNTGRAHGFVLENKNAKVLCYVSTWDKGLQVFDVSNPKDIDFLTQYNDGGDAYHVAVSDSLVFVAEFKNGLEILKIISSLSETTTSPSAETTSTSSATTSISFDLVMIVLFGTIPFLRKYKKNS